MPVKEGKLIVDLETNKLFRCAEIDLKTMKILSDEDRVKILNYLAKKTTYPRKIAYALGMNEQTVYYHLKLLKESGLIEEVKGETNFVKLYKTKKLAYCFIPGFAESSDKENINFYPEPPEFLKGFVKNGEINCKIVAPSPFPHGKYGKGSKSGYLIGEIACVLGNYGISKKRLIYLDEEMNEENRKDNLIIVGGLHVNLVQDEVNDQLPIRFDDEGTKIISYISGEEYLDPDCGFICLSENPFDKTKKIIVLAGLESISTKACIFAFKHHLNKLNKGNMYDRSKKARVVKYISENKIIFLE